MKSPLHRSMTIACFGTRLRFVVVAVVVAWTAIGFADGGATEGPNGGTWELRFCAAPFNAPMSHRDGSGFDLEIARILADELGAYATFEWAQFDAEGIRRSLHAGTCDVVIGIGESVSNVINTVPYLRAPYVFAWRTGEDPGVRSLDDPDIATVRIGTYQTGVPSIALRNRGVEDNIAEFAPIASLQGPDRHTPVLDALVDGRVDLAIVYGPMAAQRAQREEGRITYVPVAPEVELGASIVQFFRILTIGVRPHDEALRNLLNEALTERWEDVQETIDRYGVPQLNVSRPRAAAPKAPGTVRVGVILPTPTLYVHGLEHVGESARRGAVLAENTIARIGTGDSEAPFEVLMASAPSDEAMIRAAERFVRAQGALALVGGFTAAQADLIGRVTEAAGAVFMNVGAHEDVLRNELCRPSTFHVAASAAMYVDAIVPFVADTEGQRSWYLVAVDDQADALRDHVERTVVALGGALVGTASVEPGQFVFFDTIQDITSSGADGIVVALPAEEADQFVTQAQLLGVGARVALVPSLRAQTREFLFRSVQGAPEIAATERPALWDAALEVGGAADLNDRYASRNGAPMEAAAWATHAAILMLHQAATIGAGGSAEALIEYLSAATTSFDVGKGADASFRPWDHQLRQPLVLVRPRADAVWGSRASIRIGLASVVGMMPSLDEIARDETVLDRLGQDAGSSRCRF